MLRLIPATLLTLVASLAHAVEEEPPIDSNMTGVIVFFVLFVLCVIIFVWYTIKAQKTPKENKEGDKF